MRAWHWWLIGLALLAAAGGTVYIMARGIRNHNPGNIRLSRDPWRGLAPEQTDSSFFQFKAPEWGIRAMAVILLNYQRKHALHTIRQIIGRWAPSTENDTNSYIAHVSRDVGVGDSDALTLTDPATMRRLVTAIIEHENGFNPYSQTTIDQGIFFALEAA